MAGIYNCVRQRTHGSGSVCPIKIPHSARWRANTRSQHTNAAAAAAGALHMLASVFALVGCNVVIIAGYKRPSSHTTTTTTSANVPFVRLIDLFLRSHTHTHFLRHARRDGREELWCSCSAGSEI